jgi:hypothetical protein
VTLVEKIVALHRGLENKSIPHAFGGALALAWCTQQARGTNDIDLNVFVDATALDALISALPRAVAVSKKDRQLLERDGQARLWWADTPLDVFLNTTPFHDQIALRVVEEGFGGARIPFLSCRDLAVFKAFFNRTRDWADLEAMAEAGTLDVGAVLGVLVEYLGGRDERVERLRALRPS